MFQSTPSAKTEWRQENGYSQQRLFLFCLVTVLLCVMVHEMMYDVLNGMTYVMAYVLLHAI